MQVNRISTGRIDFHVDAETLAEDVAVIGNQHDRLHAQLQQHTNGALQLQKHAIHHLTSQLARLEVQAPEVLGLVVMTTGGNDIIHNYGHSPPQEGAMYGATFEQARPWIAAFDERLKSMLDRIEQCFPGGCHIFLANIYDPTDGVGDATRAGLPVWPDAMKVLAAYNEIIARHAGQRPNVHLVDIHGEFLGHGIYCTQPWRRHYRWADPHYWYYTNLEDPNDRGYDAMETKLQALGARIRRVG